VDQRDELALRSAGPLLLCAGTQFRRAAEWAKQAGILLILEFPLTSSAALPSTSNDKLHTELAEHLGQSGPGRAIAVVLNALRIVA
jgi:hypothetical protein